jgi:predicted nucleic acid-binding protein
MMVADAGPLIAFARIGRLALCHQVVGEFVVPDAVYEDLVQGGDRSGAEEVQRGAGIQRYTLRNRQALTHLPHGLAQGECEALLLAEEEGATLLIDERKAREAAEQRGIEVVGSLWVLKEAKQRGRILAVRPIIQELLAIGSIRNASSVPSCRKWANCRRYQNHLRSRYFSNDTRPGGQAEHLLCFYNLSHSQPLQNSTDQCDLWGIFYYPSWATETAIGGLGVSAGTELSTPALAALVDFWGERVRQDMAHADISPLTRHAERRSPGR